MKDFLINLVKVLMMSAKRATPGLLKITVFWNKGYGVIILVDDVTNKFYHVVQIILYMCSCNQSLVTVAFVWAKLPQPQFCKDMTRKTASFEGWSWFKFNNFGLALGTNLKFYISLAKRLKLKVREFWGLIPTFVEVTGGKLVGERGGGFLLPPPILNRVTCHYVIDVFCKTNTIYNHFYCVYCQNTSFKVDSKQVTYH